MDKKKLIRGHKYLRKRKTTYAGKRSRIRKLDKVYTGDSWRGSILVRR